MWFVFSHPHEQSIGTRCFDLLLAPPRPQLTQKTLWVLVGVTRTYQAAASCSRFNGFPTVICPLQATTRRCNGTCTPLVTGTTSSALLLPASTALAVKLHGILWALRLCIPHKASMRRASLSKQGHSILVYIGRMQRTQVLVARIICV